MSAAETTGPRCDWLVATAWPPLDASKTCARKRLGVAKALGARWSIATDWRDVEPIVKGLCGLDTTAGRWVLLTPMKCFLYTGDPSGSATAFVLVTEGDAAVILGLHGAHGVVGWNRSSTPVVFKFQKDGNGSIHTVVVSERVVFASWMLVENPGAHTRAALGDVQRAMGAEMVLMKGGFPTKAIRDARDMFTTRAEFKKELRDSVAFTTLTPLFVNIDLWEFDIVRILHPQAGNTLDSMVKICGDDVVLCAAWETAAQCLYTVMNELRSSCLERDEGEGEGDRAGGGGRKRRR